MKSKKSLSVSQIKSTMRSILRNHIDAQTNEINYTSLAEEACQILDGYGPPPNFEIPEQYFEVAGSFEVSR